MVMLFDSVAFAMFASYLLSRTLSPAYCAYFLKAHVPGEKRFWLFRVCDAGFDFLKDGYTALLRLAMRVRWLIVAGALVLLLASLTLYPLLGQELFPVTDAGQIVLNVRAPSGTRIERTEELTQQVEKVIQNTIPDRDRQMIVTDIGVLYDWPAGYTANSGPMDATMLIQLTGSNHRSTSSQEYANRLRQALNQEFQGSSSPSTRAAWSPPRSTSACPLRSTSRSRAGTCRSSTASPARSRS
jgi:multidrug efflux pump subunit AcrB